MNPELHLAFVVASTLLVAVTGPNVALILATSLAHGPRAALLTVAGTSTAIGRHLLLPVAGMASLMLLMAGWFDWLRWAGVAYLVVLGMRTWRDAGSEGAAGVVRPRRAGALYLRGPAVSAANPKTLPLFAAFFPQFVDPAPPAGPQLVGLAATFLAIAVVLDGGYAVAAGRSAPRPAHHAARSSCRSSAAVTGRGFQ